jgi:hypothetical protein
MTKPTPEEKCDCDCNENMKIKDGWIRVKLDTSKTAYGKTPSPEARVDWEKKLLTDFSKWHEDGGYLDDDWWCEEPKAVDRYLFERKKFIKSAAFEKGRGK